MLSRKGDDESIPSSSLNFRWRCLREALLSDTRMSVNQSAAGVCQSLGGSLAAENMMCGKRAFDGEEQSVGEPFWILDMQGASAIDNHAA